MSNNILIVPVQVDALFVSSERMVVEETADFSRLPYATPKVDKQPNNPYISEEIVSKPFQNTNLHLGKGIHPPSLEPTRCIDPRLAGREHRRRHNNYIPNGAKPLAGQKI